MAKLIVFITVLFSFLAATSFGSSSENCNEIYAIQVVNEFRHDPKAFTQGLLYGGNDTLFESTGINGLSTVRKVNLYTAQIEALHKMDDAYFGEGLTLLGESLRNLVIICMMAGDLRPMGKYCLEVMDLPLYIKLTLKQWKSDCVVRISPLDGTVTGWVLLPELREGLTRAGYDVDVLNGIAWDAENNRIFVTGKLWPKVYQIKLHPNKKPLRLPIEEMCLRGPDDYVKV
ncbi:hypothetical protein QVD17_31003 [Tagetes erecta]|uniref:Glutaminyl-peptide cyclotransferase n=1 Tax=Tagetes erecta TaxID=13708 RepID=A0AAD8K3T0_TARER|nr:hypothetical protein QVD17_31003 [Tagetes erecta]